MVPSTPRPLLLASALGLVAVSLLAGCLGDGEQREPMDQRLLSSESAQAAGLYHCTVGETYAQQGFTSNPGPVPTMPRETELEAPTDFWIQILSPQQEVPCEEVDPAQQVFVSAMRFASSGTVGDLLEEHEACGDPNTTVLHSSTVIVGAEGNATFIPAVRQGLIERNPDLQDPCR